MLSVECEYVKSVDFHPSKPWVLASLATGKLMVWDYETGGEIKSVQLSELPVQCAKFVARKNWILAACDGGDVHVVPCKVTVAEEAGSEDETDSHQSFRARTGSVRHMEIHHELPFVFTCSEDGCISLLDWDQKFSCRMTFDDHQQDVTMLRINPWDKHSFASSSLDRTVKIWDFRSHRCSTVGKHETGVLCVDFAHVQDKYMVMSVSEDNIISFWDLVTKSRVLRFDLPNTRGALCHPKLPVLLAWSGGGEVSMRSTCSPVAAAATIHGGMGATRALAVCPMEDDLVAIGYDQGCVVTRLNKENKEIRRLLSFALEADSNPSNEEEDQTPRGEEWFIRERARLLPYLGVVMCSFMFCIFPTEWGTIVAIPFVLAVMLHLCTGGRWDKLRLRGVREIAALNCLVTFAIIDDKVISIIASSEVPTSWAWSYLILVPEVFLLKRLHESGLSRAVCFMWAFPVVMFHLFFFLGAVYLAPDIQLRAMTLLAAWRWAWTQAIEVCFFPGDWKAGKKKEVRRSKYMFGAVLLLTTLTTCDMIYPETFLFVIFACFVLQFFLTLRSIQQQPGRNGKNGAEQVIKTGSYQPPIHVAIPLEEVV
uniref:Uncharacterized protein n=1 Tax=Pseudictyota dubia TaxID=2749911 RepID=A0A7R9Z5T0_9STRA|mmetsp:Transcript_23113/g.42852  ORF Transcript_23113/g.42852 Transcript_23113/m.42852 type:complete len:595 (+) Transcript_23113:350-2134(+)